jgi:hypothetical protein
VDELPRRRWRQSQGEPQPGHSSDGRTRRTPIFIFLWEIPGGMYSLDPPDDRQIEDVVVAERDYLDAHDLRGSSVLDR